MSAEKKNVIFLMGSTASGKTEVACRLSDEFPIELINVDSVQVYRGMDIGSAKLTVEERAQYPHHLLDIREPSEPYNAAQFRDDALGLIRAIHERGNIPLFVGGTMLYFKALLEGIADIPNIDSDIKQRIIKEAEAVGWPELHKQLAVVDSVSAERIKPNDGQRLLRALGVHQTTGKTITDYHNEQAEQRLNFPVLQIGLSPESRADLHARINQRFDIMMKQGFVDEVHALRADSSNHVDLPAFKSAGYRQLWEHLDGAYDLDEAIEKGKAASRQLAKRQVTWLRSWEDLRIFHTLSENMYQNCRNFVSNAVF